VSPPRPAHSTGLTARLDLSASLEFALLLQPDVRHVFVISGKDEANRAYEPEARTQFKRFEPRLDIHYLPSSDRKEFEAYISSLPPHSILYFLTLDRHGPDENFRPIEYLDRITAIANAPTYSWVDSSMGRGVVGGSLKSQAAQIAAVAKLTLRVLGGEAPESIPVSSIELNVPQVDWRQLSRWGRWSCSASRRSGSSTAATFSLPRVWFSFNRS
jgi:hypothetical protein